MGNRRKFMIIFVLGFFSTAVWQYTSPFRIQDTLTAAFLNTKHIISSRLTTEGNSKDWMHQVKHLKSFRTMTVKEIHDRFRNRTVNTCVNKCNPMETTCNVTTEEGWADAKISLLSLYHENETVFPWEADFLSMQPLTDLKTLPDLNRSVIRLFTKGNVQTAKKVTCRLDQTLTFRLDVYDGYGHARNSGNDVVRAWISGDSRNQQSYRAAGEVVDMRNGSYSIRIKCLWVGSIQLKVGVVYPKEYLRLAVHHNRIGSHRNIIGLFQRETIKEVTICFSLPNVPGRPCLCNFTHLNVLPFYCGKPMDSRLSCDDLKGTAWCDGVPRKDFTEAEATMAEQMTRPASETLVRHNIEITAVPNSQNIDVMSSPPWKCGASLMAQTWIKGYPRGLFNSKNKWISLICREQNFDQSRANKCLKNTTIVFTGDSNMHKLFLYLRELVNCHDIGGRMPSWIIPATCRNDSINLTLKFQPHEYPIYQKLPWNAMQFHGGVAKDVDLIPSHGKHIYLYHFFLHSAFSHLSSTFLGLRNAKEAIKRLLERNPRAIVGVRGPHVCYEDMRRNHLFGGDVMSSFSLAMYKHVFRDLWDKIVFLDGWELATAIENPTFHPDSYVPEALTRTLLSFFCDS